MQPARATDDRLSFVDGLDGLSVFLIKHFAVDDDQSLSCGMRMPIASCAWFERHTPERIMIAFGFVLVAAFVSHWCYNNRSVSDIFQRMPHYDISRSPARVLCDTSLRRTRILVLLIRGAFMNQVHLLTLLLVLVVTALPQSVRAQNSGSGAEIEIKVGEQKLEVKQETIARWKKTISTTTFPHRPKELGRAKVRALALRFGLYKLYRSVLDPAKGFTNDEAEYWDRQNLDDDRLVLELAARALVLEQADDQKIVISDRKTLTQAVNHVIPLLKKTEDVQN